LCFRMKNENINLTKLYLILEILGELNIIGISRVSDEYDISINNLDHKINLDKSKILQKLKEYSENQCNS
ncbi:MAG: hypothetical protein LBJ32_01895, partial [Oscillospiraceae bacterium]|nr:hypothetical protein [Oscillospiraceae bacterium]